jgi:hypothetical protein
MFSPARRLLEDGLSRLSDDLDALFADSRDVARREHAEQLNQAVRRLRIAGDAAELYGTLEHAAAQFAQGAMLFRIEDGAAIYDRIRIPLSSAAAFAAAVESGEPQIAATTPAEVSAELSTQLGHTATGRASLFPIDSGHGIVGIVYTWGPVENAAVELLSQVAGALYPPPPPPAAPPQAPAPLDLVNIAPVPVRPKADWESLVPEEQKLHLRAQRFSRVQVAEMRLYEAEAVQAGRSRRDLYGALRAPIDAARETFREKFFSTYPSMVDYLHLELVRTLANEDQNLLGPDYPGPIL